MARDWAHSYSCESDDDLIYQRIREEQTKEAARDGGEPVAQRERLVHRLREVMSRARQ